MRHVFRALPTLLILAAAPAAAQYGPKDVPQPEAPAAERGVRGVEVPYDETGTVTRLERDAGAVWVSAGGRMLKLHFPPETIAGLAPGDRVTVRLGITHDIEGTSSEGAGSHATDPETGSPGARPPASKPKP